MSVSIDNKTTMKEYIKISNKKDLEMETEKKNVAL